MAVWHMKMGGMTDNAEATGLAEATVEETALRAVWDRTEAGTRTLRTASAGGSADATSTYEQASHDLSRAWGKTRL